MMRSGRCGVWALCTGWMHCGDSHEHEGNSDDSQHAPPKQCQARDADGSGIRDDVRVIGRVYGAVEQSTILLEEIVR